MPTIPQTDPVNKVAVDNGTDLNGADAHWAGKAFQITKKGEVDFSGKSIQNSTIYINGGSTLVYTESKGNNKFYVEKGGKLVFKGAGKMLQSSDVVICQGGAVESTNKDIVIDGEFYANLNVSQKDGSVKVQEFGASSTYGDKDADGNAVVTPKQNITFNNKTYVDGYVRAINLTIGENAVANINQNIMYSTTVNVNGALHANKYFKTENLNLNGKMSSDWAVRATNLKMNAGSQLTADYVRATDA